ncbi:MAG: hypothetical protein NTZ83_04750 [Candidatus Pacearchaeota archaeon]|nr:hypothetical protein [Candidatus Pacearchaeota archaeon]
MVRWGWLIWSGVFSLVLFLLFYLLIYDRIDSSSRTPELMLGGKDVSSLGVFFSDIKNVILSSLVIGFALGLLTVIRFRRRTV